MNFRLFVLAVISCLLYFTACTKDDDDQDNSIVDSTLTQRYTYRLSDHQLFHHSWKAYIGSNLDTSGNYTDTTVHITVVNDTTLNVFGQILNYSPLLVIDTAGCLYYLYHDAAHHFITLSYYYASDSVMLHDSDGGLGGSFVHIYTNP